MIRVMQLIYKRPILQTTFTTCVTDFRTYVCLERYVCTGYAEGGDLLSPYMDSNSVARLNMRVEYIMQVPSLNGNREILAQTTFQ